MTGDRWERMVEKVEYHNKLPGPEKWAEWVVNREDAIKLLRDQHRAMVRLVSSMKRGKPREQALWERGFQACADRILTKLKERGK